MGCCAHSPRTITSPFHSTVAAIHGNAIALLTNAEIAQDYKAGDTIRLAAPDGSLRYGSLGLTRVDAETGVLHCDADVTSAIVAGCQGDNVCIEARDDLEDDHAALVTYLLSAVRRRDWHAVSDAANDLRVLEARR